MINLPETVTINSCPDFSDVERHRAYLRDPRSEEAVRGSPDLALKLSLSFEPQLVEIWQAYSLARYVGIDYGQGLAFIGRNEGESVAMAEFYYGPGRSPPLFDAVFRRPTVHLNFDEPAAKRP